MRQLFLSHISKLKQINLRSLNWRSSRRYLPLAILIVFILLAVGGTAAIFAKRGSSDSRVEVMGARANQAINQEFPVAIRDENDEEVTNIKMVLESAELRDEIIVQGKRATSVKGRTFLILNLKLTNDYSLPVNVNIKDYFRLTVNSNEAEKLAADIHNDPVLVQPASTKYTRIGYPINDTDSGLALWVGELDQDKHKVELNFK